MPEGRGSRTIENQMMETDWTITWLAPLMPEAAMIPESDVFLKSSHQYSSLVSVDDRVPGLLFSAPDTLIMVAQRAGTDQATKPCEYVVEQTITAVKPIEIDTCPEDQDSESADSHMDQDFVAFLDLEERAFI